MSELLPMSRSNAIAPEARADGPAPARPTPSARRAARVTTATRISDLSAAEARGRRYDPPRHVSRLDVAGAERVRERSVRGAGADEERAGRVDAVRAREGDRQPR